MEWDNEPPIRNVQNDTISITSGVKTDFWRETHYGFIPDSGHFFYQQVNKDFPRITQNSVYLGASLCVPLR
ncbi:DUF1349 domain-containing protein [Coleofasciculus sp. H7-2]|uniref:DUF1349 domain-containing protein n=1 Tax=Coleofasciculus sp. H7-2 TaxID=3351545 RepID=UPI00366B3361